MTSDEPPARRRSVQDKDALAPYASKRAFARTPEPAPRTAGSRRGPLLFVIQKHAARRLHYDLRLELDGVLKSWAVPKGPSLDVREKRMAVETEDHPFEYAAFEGVIPRDEYGAGAMIVWDCGVYSPDEGGRCSFENRDEAQQRVRSELAAGKLSFLLRGEKVKGSFALVKTSTDKQWLLIKHKDRFADGGVDLLARSRSVLSGFAVDELSPDVALERLDPHRLTPAGPLERLPTELKPMLAEIGDGPRSDPDYLYEPKLDGYRVIASLERGVVRLISRGGLDLTAAFPEIVADLAAQAVEAMIIDGEIVALSADGRASFNALQKRAQLRTTKEIGAAQRETAVAMVCFDLLHFAGVNLRNHRYVERRRYLSQCLAPTPRLQLIHVSNDAPTLYAAAVESGFEGVVAKRKDSPYQPGRRSAAWLKIKAAHTAEFVVGGYTKGKGAREATGALLLGYWRDGALHYVGHVGSGLTQDVLEELRARFAKLVVRRTPFTQKPPLHRPTTWLDPQLVVEVSFEDRTPDGMLRAPVFIRVRDDVPSRTVRAAPQPRGAARVQRTPANQIDEVLEQLARGAPQLVLAVGDARIRLTNLDREYWPADPRTKAPPVSKRDYLRYLARVSPFMLPHLKDRPLTMIRMPEGVGGERFFQKHWEQTLPEFVRTITVFSEHKEEQHDYVLAQDLPTLLWLGQVGTLEFHVWHSRARVDEDALSKSVDYAGSIEALEASVLNYPDYLVFDIDPYVYSGLEAQGAEPELNKKGFSMGKRVAFWLHALLREMSLEAVVKTSGKTGLHVFVPIERTVTFDEARAICELVGRHLMREHPREITMEWAVVKRTGKIFIDYNMNVRGKTLNVAYSPRGAPGAPVSMPLTWEELEAAEPLDFTVHNAIARLERTGDRWHDVLAEKQSLALAFGSKSRK